MNGSTFRPVPPTPPPPGYYGDTRELLMKVMTPIIISFGTVGNMLTIIVLLRQTKKMSSTSMYLLALALSDIGLLWCSPFRAWLKYMWDIDVRYINDASCRIHLYFTYAFIHLSSWILVAVTIERTLGVISPHKVKFCCTTRNAGFVIASICVFIFGTDLVIPMISSIDGYQPLEGHAPIKCAPSTKDYTEFRDVIWQWLDLSITFLIPFVCIVVGNTLIIFHLHKARKNQRVMKIVRGRRAQGTKRRGTVSVSILMIALCFIFLATMTPVAVFQIYYPYRHEEINEMFMVDPYKAWDLYQYFLFQHAVVNLVSYTNASFNFLLYVFSGTKFRAELKAALCCSKIRQTRSLFSTMSRSTTKLQKSRRTNLTKRGDNCVIDKDFHSVKSTVLVKNAELHYGHIYPEIHDCEKNTDLNHTDEQYRGKDNLVFSSDEGISSLSSILSTYVDKDLVEEHSEIDQSFDDVFTDADLTLSSNPTMDIIEERELTGFILHL